MKIKNTSIYIEKGIVEDFSVDAIVLPVVFSEKESNVSVLKDRETDQATIKISRVEKASEGNVYFDKIEGRRFQYVFSAVVFDVKNHTSQENIRKTVFKILQVADYLKLTSLAIPSLINNSKIFPLAGEAKIIIQEILKFLKSKKTLLEKIILCLPEEFTLEIFTNTISGYVSHLQDTLGDGPYVTVDVIIEMDEGIILIERSNPPYGWALPGGFVDYGESLETAVVREAKEETNMDLKNLEQFHVYSEPNRDPRFHTVSTVFIAEGIGVPSFGDDAKGLKIVKYNDLLKLEYAFDHNKIIYDYLKKKGR